MPSPSHRCVHQWDLQVIAHGFDVDVSVDQSQRLGAQHVSKARSAASYGDCSPKKSIKWMTVSIPL